MPTYKTATEVLASQELWAKKIKDVYEKSMIDDEMDRFFNYKRKPDWRKDKEEGVAERLLSSVHTIYPFKP